MRTWTKSLIGLAILAMAASPAQAQREGRGGQGQGPGGRGVGMGMTGGAGLANVPAVQEELKLTEEQIGKVRTLVQETRTKVRERMEGLSEEDRRGRGRELMTEVGEEARKELSSILDEGQRKRLEQIELQVRGVEAFADEKVHEALKLEQEQRAKVRQILADATEKRREIMQGAQGDFQAAMTDIRALRDESLEKVRAVLTDAQKETWKELTGEPVDMPAFGGRGAGAGRGEGASGRGRGEGAGGRGRGEGGRTRPDTR